MRKYFKYLIKKNIPLFVVLTAVLTIATFSELLTARLFYTDGNTHQNFASGIPFSALFAIIGISCVFVAVYTFRYKMDKRSIDTYYSLPITRQELMISHYIVGLLVLLASFTTVYFASVINLSLRQNLYNMSSFFVGYPIAILSIILFYTINVCIFTKANNVVDGCIFILGYLALFFMIATKITDFVNTPFPAYAFTTFFPILGAFDLTNDFAIKGYDATINAKTIPAITPPSEFTVNYFNTYQRAVLGVIFSIILTIILVVYTILTLKRERAEDVEGTSEQFLGYKLLIPTYSILLNALNRQTSLNSNSFTMFSIYFICAIILTMVYKRKIKIPLKWLGICFASNFLGMLLQLI